MLTLITGASGGIGEALARELAARPSDLILVARSADKLQALADELARAHRITTHVVAVDLAQPGAAARVADAARAIGRVDVLVNNAGFATFGPFAASDLAVEIDEIRLNVETLTDLTKRMLPDLLAAKGRILNVASTAAFQPGPVMAVYYATKAYVLSFSEALAFELKPSGVRRDVFVPGADQDRLSSARAPGRRAAARRWTDGRGGGRTRRRERPLSRARGRRPGLHEPRRRVGRALLTAPRGVVGDQLAPPDTPVVTHDSRSRNPGTPEPRNHYFSTRCLAAICARRRRRASSA